MKAWREVELHWKASGCPFIVGIKDVYQNKYAGSLCLLVVMEWYVDVLGLFIREEESGALFLFLAVSELRGTVCC